MSNNCLRIGLLLSLLQCSHQSCLAGTASQCKNADFPPGINLAGEGFDITKMARKGAFVIDLKLWERKDKTCTLCPNPFLEGKKQKLPLSVTDWRPNQSCKMKLSSSTYRSSEALVTSSSSSMTNDWKTDLELGKAGNTASLILAGTNSKLAEYSMEKTKSDKFSFTSQSISCEYYSFRLVHKPRLHKEFYAALKDLPKTFSPENKQRFYKLIDTYGTHYITQVKLGGSVKSVTSIRQCMASLQGLSAEEVEMCLQAEAAVSIGVQNLKSEGKHCNKDIQKSDSKSSFSSMFNDRFTEIEGGETTEPDLLFSAGKDPSAYKAWLDSVPRLPNLVSYSLSALHELLPAKKWDVKRKHLRTAISHYILERALMRNCSERCKTGVRRSQSEPCACSCQGDPAVTPDCCPSRRGMARVLITVQKATGLWGDSTTSTDGFVKITFAGTVRRQTPVWVNNNNPTWGSVFDLGDQDLSAGRTLRLEVWDQDSGWDDDLLGTCGKVVGQGVTEEVCALQHGRLYFKWEVRCAPSLGGADCMEYKASPMSQQLQKAFVSRHSQRVPQALLKENGVFLAVPGRHGNQSATSPALPFFPAP
ncbi:perforin-1-like [Gadus chalcogrammus]|uniref:perforin-1-like n=1 Tax=Gadus chalcogrammus TaxID=1042646 RepID=UPI0024C2AA8C|nr:perforin-1-like [Gadus chalcogrammus]XP_056467490.1 perforin-1-like [Gadus chalcogrammus]XP_056467497.1 perforin-1-like [Gadus chalcogrammus]XP_056467505.1 perforin-1-like [Gadus chalcogrammus]